ncbi:YebC/PmpR family DNA-binding transcriptional regulator [Brevibacillus sp. SYP-B805]|uniref:YebC/PmpR family DNA-binding transcriptional regulator n=1 Tax=Brevibacillus sp. SYP-B805 TaxID=1578199 RepID=UPI0013EB1CB2|nr:YebC/PmpR family DNA-binding transcriptional regulator [Brevibacillus sp. SYP-B805]NGQ96310.1 YebC/PmpR family DNA-binding transcriptional regulator [Brevibacillus sp. SYP-B805]
MPKFKLFANKKGIADQKRNNQYVKFARQIYVEAKKGGPDPNANLKLKAIIANARAIQMPMENIERAIKKATDTGNADNYEEIRYEGYGPGGVAVIVECLTDNRNRTAADVRAIFNKRGGNLGETGSVSFMFDRKGVIVIDRETHAVDEDTILMHALEAGAEDVVVEEDTYEILTHPHELDQVKAALEKEGYTFSNAQVQWLPQTTTKISGEDAAKMLKMMEAFEENDDVQNVYANYEIDDDEMEKLLKS